MSKRYTVTVYVAAPGTPLTKEDGSPLLLPGSNKQDYSVVGHLYYKISDGTRDGTKGFGFAPKKAGKPFGEGEIKKDEFKKYQNPIYERTLEISEQQYKKLLNYGNNPALGGFDQTKYRGTHNSCVDFLYGGLAYAHVYNPERSKLNPRSWFGDKNYEGEFKVRPNMDELDKIPNQKEFEHSELNTPLHERRKNPEPGCEKAFGKMPTVKELFLDKKSWEGISDKIGCRLAENETGQTDINIASSNPDKAQRLRALIDGFKNDTDGSFAAMALEENRDVVENFKARQQEWLNQNMQQQVAIREIQPEIRQERNFGGLSFG